MTGTPRAADVLRVPPELQYADELERIADHDQGPRPDGWRLSPRAVRAFVIGDDDLGVSRKFVGDDPLVDRCVVTLMSNRGLLLVGEPGTAKSMLSELLAAAVSGDSTCTVQGSSGVTEDKIAYSWNYSLLLSEGPSLRSLVPGPVHRAMAAGRLCRVEEVTRIQPEIQDVLIGVLSEKVLHVPELPGDDALCFARPGFNVVATANLRDRGVHEMSSALKRRFNFETVRPIADPAAEAALVSAQTSRLLADAGVPTRLDADLVDVLVTVFRDLRRGVSADGVAVERPTAVMSAAEAVSVGHAAALDAHYLGDGRPGGEHLVRQLIGTVLKDDPDDGDKLRHYLDVVVSRRARDDELWRGVLSGRAELDRRT
jgi:MoxR-like ATPase